MANPKTTKNTIAPVSTGSSGCHLSTPVSWWDKGLQSPGAWGGSGHDLGVGSHTDQVSKVLLSSPPGAISCTLFPGHVWGLGTGGKQVNPVCKWPNSVGMSPLLGR